MSQREIARVRALDRRDKEAYIAAVNRQKQQPEALLGNSKPVEPNADFLQRLWVAIVQWWHS